MVVELWPHQQKAVEELHNGCILRGGVGSGKTITSLYYYYTKVMGGVVGDPLSLRDPMDLVVITTAQKRDKGDWQHDASLFRISGDRETSVAGLRVEVDSWNNLSKYETYENCFFIFDEQKVIGAGAWTKSFLTVAGKNKWILLSATPGDRWLDYIPVFLAHGMYKNRTEFKREHVVYSAYTKFPKVERYIGVNKLIKNKNKVLVEMPFERHTKRHLVYTKCDYDKQLYKKVMEDRWHVYEDRPIREVSELFSVMRKVVNSDTSRIEKLMEVLTKHSKLIVFYNFDYELEILKRCLTTNYETDSSRTSSNLPGESIGAQDLLLETSTHDIGGSGINGTPRTQAKTPSMPTKSLNKSTSSDTTSSEVTLDLGLQPLSQIQTLSMPSAEEYNGVMDRSIDQTLVPTLESSTTGPTQTKACTTTCVKESIARRVDQQSLNSLKQSSLALSPLQKQPDFLDSTSTKSLSTRNNQSKAVDVLSGSKTFIGHPSKWANPYVVGIHGTREEVLDAYRNYVLGSSLYNDLDELSGQELICRCGEELCHRDVLVDLLVSRQPIWSPVEEAYDEFGVLIGGSGETGESSQGLGDCLDGLVVAELNGHKHDPVPTSDRWVYLVQYLAGAEAWNCVETDAMAFYSMNYSWRIFEQAQGRNDRLNTPFVDLWYYVLTSDSFIDKEILKAIQTKQNFNEARSAKDLGFKGTGQKSR